MKIFAANWKLNKSPAEARAFFEAFHKRYKTVAEAFALKKIECETIFFPSAFALEATQQMLRGSKLKFGPQNVFSQGQGAFTGENSALIAKSMGSRFVLVGHSERRQFFSESNDLLADKIKYLVDIDLSPMLCIGETLEQRQSGQTLQVCKEQLTKALAKISTSEISQPLDLVVAYEPIWAIGTGVVASLEQVKETHAELANVLHELGFAQTPILYGGSVKADNAKELIRLPHVDGFLVGGAALEVESFAQICESVLSKY